MYNMYSQSQRCSWDSEKKGSCNHTVCIICILKVNGVRGTQKKKGSCNHTVCIICILKVNGVRGTQKKKVLVTTLYV